MSSDRFVMASNAVDAIAAMLAVVFVLRLTRRQEARAAKLSGIEG